MEVITFELVLCFAASQCLTEQTMCSRMVQVGLERLGLLVVADTSDAFFDLPQPLCFNPLRPLAMDFIVVFTMQELFEVLADFLPLPIALRCLRVSRRGQLLSALGAWSRARGRSYAFIRHHVQNALTGGVWCPGLDCVTTGMLHLDTGAAPLQEQILTHYHVNAVDELDLRPSTADFTETMDATPLMAWHCGNSDTLRWRLLSTFCNIQMSGFFRFAISGLHFLNATSSWRTSYTARVEGRSFFQRFEGCLSTCNSQARHQSIPGSRNAFHNEKLPRILATVVQTQTIR